ncbi:hypothetical protein BDR03DRAFT_976458, partial [Suillus americanus]
MLCCFALDPVLVCARSVSCDGCFTVSSCSHFFVLAKGSPCSAKRTTVRRTNTPRFCPSSSPS